MEWESRKLNIRYDIAPQADSSVYLQYGNTVVLATVVMEEESQNYIDFIPLSVHYIEKAYAARRIPGGYVKREGRPQDHEVLTSRLIDRALRPLITDGLQNEVQVIITVLSYDPDVGTVIPSFLAASIALQRSCVPFKAPLAACHVGLLNNKIVINPTKDQLKLMDTDFIVAGNEKKVIMLEGRADEISGADMMKIAKSGVKAYQPIIQMLKDIKPVNTIKKPILIKSDINVKKDIHTYKKQLQNAFHIAVKQKRRQALQKFEEKFVEKYTHLDSFIVKKSFAEVSRDILAEDTIKTKKRMDGRAFEEIRPIKIETKLLPNVHASTLFTRGETQVLGTLTLGRLDEKQMVDELSGMKFCNLLSHYNFPKFSVGEVDRMSAPARREIGHGQIAYRSFAPFLKNPLYTYRFVYEVLSSNGSSSMASVCAGSLCLMEAGIDLKRHIAGIALGLVVHQSKSAILVDISGDEDHLGCMDFKICATEKGITALQMDVSIKEGVSLTMLNNAIQLGYKSTLQIIAKMKKKKLSPSKHLPQDVKRVDYIKIDRSKAKQLLTRKNDEGIRSIEKVTNTRIDLVSDRFIVSSENLNNVFRAKKSIYEALHIFNKDQVYEAEVIDAENGKIKIEGYFEGCLQSHKKLHNGDVIRVKFVEIDRKGNLEMEFFHDAQAQVSS